jgi:hypothetical protein
LRNAGNRRSRRRHDHHNTVPREGDGPGLLEIASVRPDHRKIGGTGGKCLGGIKHIAGILDPEPDRRIRGGEAAGDNRGDLLTLAVERSDRNGQCRRLQVKPIGNQPYARDDAEHPCQQDGANPERQCDLQGFHMHPGSEAISSGIGIVWPHFGSKDPD